MVERVFADRVKETTTSTGTGNITLGGAASQFVSFNAAFGVGPSFDYLIKGQTGTEWEAGEGHLSSSSVLVRDTVRASSNAGALVNFSAGTKDVFNDIGATSINKLQTLAEVRKAVSLRL